MVDTLAGGGLLRARLKAASGHLFWIGLGMSIVGIAALVFPMISTLVTTLMVGWVFLFAGILMLASAFTIHGTGPFFGALLIGLLTTAAGLFFLFNPLAGAVALTLMVAIIFVIQGASELVIAFEMRPDSRWVWMLLSALASIVLAAVLAFGFPAISQVALGILLGVNFLTTGLGYIFLSQAFKD